MSDEQISDIERARALFRAMNPRSKTLHFMVIEGEPPSKARPRVTSSGRVYVPEKQKAMEAFLAMKFRDEFPEPMTGNIAIGCVFFRSNHQRIDVDNMMKHVLDSANKVVWVDDYQVTALMGVMELDTEHPRTIIVIGDHESTLVRNVGPSYCKQCGKEFRPKHMGAKRPFCSHLCFSMSIAPDLKMTVVCPGCDTEFKRKSKVQLYCSKPCQESTRWKHKKKSSCADCSKPLSKVGYGRCRACWKTWVKTACKKDAS